MKSIFVFIAALLLLSLAGCTAESRESVPTPTIVQRTEVVVDADIDPQESYPMEEPKAEESFNPQTNGSEKKPESQEKEDQAKADELAQQKEEEKAEILDKDKASEQGETPKEQEKEPPQAQETIKPQKQEPEKMESSTKPSVSAQGEVRAVWFSYFEYASLLTGQSEGSFAKNIGAAFETAKAAGLNTVIVQVRPYSDALYQSEYFPWSYLATGEEGKNPGFDPLKIMVEQAHARGLEIEAWINPYRVRSSGYKKAVSAENPVNDMLESGDAVEFNGGLYYDPASPKARKLIINGVVEIVRGYDIDGIHFDDYFYPTTDKTFDETSYKAYKREGGSLSLADWRRENVNQLVRGVYAAIQDEDSSVRFGISPQGNMKNNYDQQFIDVKLWLSTPGYVDYICPQIYFGFENETCPYEETVAAWNKLIQVQGIELYVGLSPFKLGLEDRWAGRGKNEWKNTTDILQRMVAQAREEQAYQGFALFRYDSLFRPAEAVKSQVQKELGSLKEILQ